MSLCSKNNKKVHEQRDGGRMTTTTVAAAAMRKGPWTEEEDAHLVRFVRLFGERRWDFLAKVSGLRRTGKSCRLRWVNYLHPGLRRGRITADEERLILELHARWGSRWSRIARSLPGRTDNEIKNFWRTRTRKQKAAAQQERRQSSSNSTASLTSTDDCPGSPNSCKATTASESALRESVGDDEASTTTAASQQPQEQTLLKEECCTMDQLWNEISAAEAAASYVVDCWGGTGHGIAATEPPASPPVWEFCSDYYSLWRIDDEEYYKNLLCD